MKFSRVVSYPFCINSMLLTLTKARLFCSVVFSVSVLLSRALVFPFRIDSVVFTLMKVRLFSFYSFCFFCFCSILIKARRLLEVVKGFCFFRSVLIGCFSIT